MVTRTVFQSREEWLEGRKGHIGGSDASVCVGMNPYKDNIQLWEEKTGLVIPEDISDKSYVKYGTEAEQHIRALFALEMCIRDRYNSGVLSLIYHPRVIW